MNALLFVAASLFKNVRQAISTQVLSGAQPISHLAAKP